MFEREVDCFHKVPRLALGFYPTPVEEMSRLRLALGGGPRLWIKRDDYTGPGFGGNKVRKLEYMLARAMDDGADTILTTGGLRSNHARVTAALAARLGLECHLILNAPAGGTGSKPASLHLDEMYGATIHTVGSREERAPTMSRMAEELRARGRRPMEIPLGASTPLGALGYVRAAEELAAQKRDIDWIFHASSSGGTQSGLEVGLQLFGMPKARLVGISPDDAAASIAMQISAIVDGIGSMIGAMPGTLRRKLIVEDSFVGPGYGIPSPEGEEALQLVAQSEGIILDPVYTAKAMAALIAMVRAYRFRDGENVLFWHTGGQMALFKA